MGFWDFVKGVGKVLGGAAGITCPKCGSFNVQRCKESQNKGKCMCLDCLTEWTCIPRDTDPKCNDLEKELDKLFSNL